MSWTKRINHPSELVHIGDEVDVVILDIDKEKEEIALGMKQAQENPWLKVAEKYPVGSVVEGVVKSVTSYGAFVQIEEGVDGLLHVSDMSWTRRVTNPEEILKPGQKIKAKVLMVDVEKCRISLGLKQLTEDPWERKIPQRYQRGTICMGRVTAVTNYGAFVELEPELEGLIHISEFAERGQNIHQVLHEGDFVEVRVIRLDPVERRIGLTLRRVLPKEEAAKIRAALGLEEESDSADATASSDTADTESAQTESEGESDAAQSPESEENQASQKSDD